MRRWSVTSHIKRHNCVAYSYEVYVYACSAICNSEHLTRMIIWLTFCVSVYMWSYKLQKFNWVIATFQVGGKVSKLGSVSVLRRILAEEQWSLY